MDDDELAARLQVVRQAVNQAARRLERKGVLRRYVGPSGKIVNAVPDSPGLPVARSATPARVASAADAPPEVTPVRSGSGIVLVTCVKEKASSPQAAKDLYRSSLFRKERAYAEATGKPWFILSAEHGLVGPDEWVAPYERYLPDTPRAYREAWGGWVIARLELLVGRLKGRTVEIHASEEYVVHLRSHLRACGALLVEPLAGLRQGERLAWYDAQVPVEAMFDYASVEDLVRTLSDQSLARSPVDVTTAGSEGWRRPGLYSWWVDVSGADELTRGLGHEVPAGLVYAGLAGATKWPSGKPSKNTLWSRITGMHLGGNHMMSTLRRTFGSILAEGRGWTSIDEDALTAWMGEHLRVVMVTYDDADGLGQMETAVLEHLDPPLNLQGMASTPLRRDLSRLRSAYSARRDRPDESSDRPPRAT